MSCMSGKCHNNASVCLKTLSFGKSFILFSFELGSVFFKKKWKCQLRADFLFCQLLPVSHASYEWKNLLLNQEQLYFSQSQLLGVAGFPSNESWKLIRIRHA